MTEHVAPTVPSEPVVGARLQVGVLLLGVLALLIAFAPTLQELVQYWSSHPEYSHGFLMPPVAAWLLWDRRAELRQLTPRASLGGVVLLALSLAVLVLGEMKLSWFLKPYAFVGALAGLTWATWGWRAIRLAMPAFVVLLLMCPLPGRVQNAITLPLKNTAAVFATGLLDVTGFPVALEGNVIRLPGIRDLWVADACSGLRSLISLVSLALISGFLWRRHWLLRVLVVVSAVPIAVLVNGLRIWGTGVLSVRVGPQAAEDFFHFFEGVALFGIAGALLWGWAILLGQLFPRGDA